jgi:CheY-like chemotaxis protein
MAAAAAVEQLNVLVIDDDPDMRRLLVDIITRREHQAVPAGSAEEGLSLLPHWTFQLAFLDHNLPGMEGILLGEYLRRHNPDMTIALVTGEESNKLERRTKDLHIQFIPKPFEVERIARVIDECRDSLIERDEQRRRREDSDFEPPIARYVIELTEVYGIPNVPARIEDRLVETLKRSLSNLRTAARYSERDRVVALAGLVTARVLGVDLPKSAAGATLYEEFDRCMKDHGRRTEFED